MESFDRSDLLGSGSFCDVFLCTERASGEQYAMKVVPRSGGPQDQATVMEEHCLRRLAGSPCVVELLCSFDSPFEWIGVLEFCSGGELWKFVKDTGCYLETEVQWFAAQMVEALAVVHDALIVHRDVKCENFLLTSENLLKIIDFGTARDAQHPEVETMLLGPQYKHHVGTPNFMAPEAINGRANDQRSDLWSLGGAIYQLALGVPPYNAPTPFLIMSKAQNGAGAWLPSCGCSERLQDLIRSLMQSDPSSRLGAGGTLSILEHPLFTDAPSTAPVATPLAEGLRHCARAAAGEAARAAAPLDNVDFHIFGGPKGPASQPQGAEVERLLQDLPAVVAGEGQGLLKAVLAAADGAAADFGMRLASAAASGSLPSLAKEYLQRVSEVVEQKKREESGLEELVGLAPSDEASTARGSLPDEEVQRRKCCCLL